jgi:hypothetical protein
MVVLLCGVAITIAPDLGSSSPSSNTFGTGAGGFVVLQCVAVVPLALAMLFVELQVYCRSASLFVCVGVWVRACVRACVSAYPSVSLPLCLLVSLSLSLSLSSHALHGDCRSRHVTLNCMLPVAWLTSCLTV